MLGKKAVHNRILSYFQKEYGKYDDETEWYVDPDDFSMKGFIPSLEVTILFTCDPKTGKVSELATHDAPTAVLPDDYFEDLYVKNVAGTHLDELKLSPETTDRVPESLPIPIPCSSCGMRPTPSFVGSDGDGSGAWIAFCSCNKPKVTIGASKADAIVKWNIAIAGM